MKGNMKEANEVEIEECFAVPGKTMIDVIHPVTGLSKCFGQTLEQVQARYPGAVRMTLQAWCEQKAQSQDTPITWTEATEEAYEYGFECLPPAAFGKSGAFLVGEPCDHHALTGQPRFTCYKKEGGKHYEASRPITRKEFRSMFPAWDTEQKESVQP